MSQYPFIELIPVEKQESVRKALQSAFNVSQVDSITALTNGYSGALVYKITLNSDAYLLRITMEINDLTEPARQFTCMTLAAEEGIAPKVYYTDAEQGLSITQFIESRPMAELFAAISEPAKLAGMVKSIHSLPLFPSLINFLDGIDQLIGKFKSFRMFAEEAVAEAFLLYEEIKQAYRIAEDDMVSSHNDLNPNNLLFDGDRLWVVDWEASFRNDPYVDLAIAAQSYVNTPEKINLFLEAYFEGPLNEYQQARFFLMQQICLMYYAMLMFIVGFEQAPSNQGHQYKSELPSLGQFRALLKNQELTLDDFETKVQYGNVLFNTMLTNMQSETFSAAVDTLKKQLLSTGSQVSPLAL